MGGKRNIARYLVLSRSHSIDNFFHSDRNVNSVWITDEHMLMVNLPENLQNCSVYAVHSAGIPESHFKHECEYFSRNMTASLKSILDGEDMHFIDLNASQ